MTSVPTSAGYLNEDVYTYKIDLFDRQPDGALQQSGWAEEPFDDGLTDDVIYGNTNDAIIVEFSPACATVGSDDSYFFVYLPERKVGSIVVQEEYLRSQVRLSSTCYLPSDRASSQRRMVVKEEKRTHGEEEEDHLFQFLEYLASEI